MQTTPAPSLSARYVSAPFPWRRRRDRSHRALLAALVACLVSACGSEAGTAVAGSGSGGRAEPRAAPEPARYQGEAFGTYFRVTWTGDGASAAAKAVDEVQPVVDAALARGNELFNSWSGDSVISRLNGHDSVEPFPVPAPFAEVLDLALRIARSSNGAYDPTVAPLLGVLGFGPAGRPDAPPTEAAIAAARERIGYDRIELRREGDGFVVVKARPDVEVELSSVAKGYIVDRVSEALANAGIANHLVDIGGELVARGRKAPDTPWRVAVERPPSVDDPSLRAVQSVLSLENRAIATSGSYRNFIRDGHHILDPRTGKNPVHRFASVSVLAPDCALADALATALMVTGYEAGLDLLDTTPDVQVLFLEVAADGTTHERAVNWPE